MAEDKALRVAAQSEDLRKPHEMIVMLPRAGRITLTGRRIYNALLHHSQGQMAALQEMPPADFLFRAPLMSLLRATGSSGEQRTAAKKYLQEMRGLEVDWESTAAGDGVKWKGFAMLSEVAIEERNGENWVSWSYPPTIMAALKEPARWARLDLEVLGQLGTYTALALYEICARYRDNPSGVTSRKPVDWWTGALSNTPAGSEKREWRKFKNEKLNAAIAEVNRETEIDVELIEHKQGRAVEEAQFSVRKKHRTKVAAKAVEVAVVDVALVQAALQMGIREEKLDQLLREFGDEKVQAGIEALKVRVVKKQFREIENSFSYLRTLLRNGVDQPDTSGVVAAPQEPVAEQKPAKKDVFSTSAAGEGAPSEGALRLQKLREELEAMPAENRRVFVAQAVARLTEKGLYTPLIRRRHEQGDELHGILGSMVIQCYSDNHIR